MNQIKEFTRYNLFGWDVFKKTLPAGEEYRATVDEDTPFLDFGLTTVWTKGRITAVNTSTGEAGPTRVPGYLTDTTKVIPAGVYEFKVEEATEWFCLPSFANGNDSPKLSPVVIKQGESFILEPGTLVAFLRGAFVLNGEAFNEVPVPIEIGDSARTVVAEVDTFGLIFDRKKDVQTQRMDV